MKLSRLQKVNQSVMIENRNLVEINLALRVESARQSKIISHIEEELDEKARQIKMLRVNRYDGKDRKE